MRILYALDSYRPNIDGVGISIERQARGLVARGHKAALIVPAYGLADYEEEDDGLRILRVRAPRLIRRQWRLAIIPSDIIDTAFEDFAPDVVVVSVPFPINFRVQRAARRRGVPIVGITGTMPEWLVYSLGPFRAFAAGFYNLIWDVMTSFYNRCEIVVGVTATAMSYLEGHDLARPTRIISNGVDLDTFRPRSRDATVAARLGLPDKPTVLYAGRLDAEKRMDVWIKAIPYVLERTDAHFIIGGDGSERSRLMEEVAKMGLSEHVTFTGFLSTEEYPLVYSLADVFAIASPAELQSIVTLEAAASGLPIVGVNAGALPELVHPGRNGYLFPDGDSEELAADIRVLLADPTRARIMGSQSRAIAHRHDIRDTIEQYEALYAELVEAAPVVGWDPLRQVS